MNKTSLSEKLIAQLTLDEQVSLLSGEDFWSLPAIDRLKIPKLRVTDGPNGARGGGSLVGGITAAAFPVGIALGATWNPELVTEIGEAIADEVKSKGAQVLLAPTVNIQRTLTNGRNFECYSEDPELSAALTVAYVTGVQSQNIACTVKHFAGNESEIERTTINSVVDERSLREIYLRPFEAAVKRGQVWALMSSYNRLNGTYTAEHPWLLTELLRDEWGFDGVVMSDWFGSHSTVESINAGLDLEMPGPTRDRGEKLIKAVESGAVSAKTVRDRAHNILRLMERVEGLTPAVDSHEIARNRPEHRALIRRAGAEAIVLLKNDSQLLPLNPSKAGTIAVIGPNAKIAQIMGGGSAQLNPHYRVSPWDGLAAAVGEENLHFAQGCSNYRWEPLYTGDIKVAYYPNRDFSGEPVYQEQLSEAVAFWVHPVAQNLVRADHFSARITTQFRPDQSGVYNLGFHCAGYAKIYLNDELVLDAWTNWRKGRTFFEEGCDEIVSQIHLDGGKTYEIRIDFCSRPFDNLQHLAWRMGISQPLGDADIDAAVACAKRSDTAMIFVGRSGEWDTEGSDLENISLPGRQDELVSAVLDANPNTIVVLQTGGPVDLPWLDKASTLVQAWYPGQECGNAIADIIFGDEEPTGRLPQTFPRRWSDNPTYTDNPINYPGLEGQVHYGERLNIGYRHYDAHQISPQFPFGFGLGYTHFELSNLSAEINQNAEVELSVDIENRGARSGTTVIQFYVTENSARVTRPKKELKAFQKISLENGARTRLQLKLEPRAFAYCDTEARGWRVDSGDFTILAGFSAIDLPERFILKLESRFESY